MSEQSDRPIVPANLPNKTGACGRAAEGGEGRAADRGESETARQGPDSEPETALQRALDRIHEVARRDKATRFTSLLHHIYDVDRLRAAFRRLNRKAVPGIDNETCETYESNLEANLQDLSARLARGAYRAKPVRRARIPKPDGGQRPLGIPVLEDKIVQGAAAEVLGAIYEADFRGFSYGFRPGLGPEQALDALYVALMGKVNWLLDADIRGFFDAIDHECLMKFLEQRIGDGRVLRLIRKWLKAGVLEDGSWRPSLYGTPQGGVISPLLANVYLHYVFDQWIDAWRQDRRGTVVVVRFADDYIVGFQYQTDAEALLTDLRTRLAEYGLELHPEKTRLIEFGRFAIRDRRRRGDGPPDTFDFLGFTHICSTGRGGGFVIRRRTIRKRLAAKLKAIRAELRHRMHWPVPKVGRWLNAVINGYFNYHAIPTNGAALWTFRNVLARSWYFVLRRRSERDRTTWERMNRLVARWFPAPVIRQPWPWERFRSQHSR